MGYIFHFDADSTKNGPNYAHTAWKPLFAQLAARPLETCTRIYTGDLTRPGVVRAMGAWLSPVSPKAAKPLPGDRDSLFGRRNVFVTLVNGGDAAWAAEIDRALQACPTYLGCRPVTTDRAMASALRDTLSSRFWVAGKEAAIYGSDAPDERDPDPDLELLLTSSGFTFIGYSLTPPRP